jgi:hypothetical protein
MIREAMQMLVRINQSPAAVIAPIVLAWACAFAFYTAGDALTGYFLSKEPKAKMTE